MKWFKAFSLLCGLLSNGPLFAMVATSANYHLQAGAFSSGGASASTNFRIQSSIAEGFGYLTQVSTNYIEDGGYIPVVYYGVSIDTDGDGIIDLEDNCPIHINPAQVDTDGDGLGNACDPDDDNDGMTDVYEIANDLDRLDPSDANLDLDGDGLTNLEEFNLGTFANDTDSDNDGVLDGMDSDPLNANATGFERGTASFNHNWQTVNLPSEFTNPIVIAGPPTLHGNAPGVVRLRNVTNGATSSFDIRFQEWPYLDGLHGTEAAPYLVVESGITTLSDGRVMEAGTLTVAQQRSWRAATFSHPFAEPPLLLLTIQTENEIDTVTVRARDLTNTGFTAAFFEQESDLLALDTHAPETVGYLAIEYGNDDAGAIELGGHLIPYLLQTEAVNSVKVPVHSGTLYMEEEQSNDTERGHGDETVNALILGQHLFAQDISTLSLNTAAIRHITPEQSEAMEWGTVNSVTDQWVIVPMAKTYTNPIVIAKPAKLNDPANSGVVQLRNITSDSFEARFAEWDYLDDSHTAERIFYLVAETGTQTLGTLNVEAGTVETTDVATYQPLTAFTATPVLFAAPQTVNEPEVVTTRINTLSASGFDVNVQEQQSLMDGHGIETVGYIAISPGTGTTGDGKDFEVRTTFTNHNPRFQRFAAAFNRKFPVTVTDLASTNGAETATAAQLDLYKNGVRVNVAEEQSFDAELLHQGETISIFAAE